MSAYREVVSTEHFTIGTDDIAGRNLRLVLGLGDNLLGQTGRIVGFGVEGDAFNDILELQCSGIFGDDNGIEWVPFGHQVALFHAIALFEVERRTVGNIERAQNNLGIRVDEAYFGQSAHDHLALLVVLIGERNGANLVEFDLSVVLCNDTCIGCGVTGNSSGVEGSQRKLCTRLTNRLSCNDTGCLAKLNHAGSSKVSAVTFHADTALAFAGEHRTDFNHLDR